MGKEKLQGQKNPDLWKRFLKIYSLHKVSFQWIKGHAGHPQNEKCDQLAVMASDEPDLLVDHGYENSSEDNQLFRK